MEAIGFLEAPTSISRSSSHREQFPKSPQPLYYIDEIDPLSVRYLLQYRNFSHYKYLKEMFNAMDIKNIQDEKYILDVLENLDESIGVYDEKYFDTYLCKDTENESDLAETKPIKNFKAYKPGEYDKNTGFYKTKDGKYIMEIQY